MPEHALARRPIAGPPASRTEAALGHAQPVRALAETAQRLNASPVLATQHALAARLSGAAPVQLMPKRKNLSKRETPAPKVEKEDSEDEGERVPLLVDNSSEHSGSEESEQEETVTEKPKRGRPKKRVKVTKTKVSRGRPRKEREIVDTSSEEEEERSESPERGRTRSEELNDPSSEEEEEEREESPVRGRPEKKEVKKKGDKEAMEMDDEYSDSEAESSPRRRELAQEHGVRNYTKYSRKKGTAKVVNKVPKTGVEAAAGQLMAHAKQIQSKATGKSSGPTTITTALLLHKPTGIYKKFAFTNIGLMAAPLRREAESLGYHVVKAPETHAEGQLIQYLYVRDPVYGHHNMGVDKDHCAECQILMQTYFGEEYGTKAGKSNEIFTHYKSPSLLRLAVGAPEFGPITKFRTHDGGKNELAKQYGKSDEGERSESEESEVEVKKPSKKVLEKKVKKKKN